MIFLGGFRSDMTGTKAVFLEERCRARGVQFTRFDYRGHGDSSGAFEDGTIGDWADDALAVLREVTSGRQILVGSSMGGWIMCLVGRAEPGRVAGLVGIAAAPDFTEDLMWNGLGDDFRAAIERDGRFVEPSQYDGHDHIVTKALIEDGRTRLVLRAPLAIGAPARLIHGMRDPDVPWETSVRLAGALTAEDVQVRLIKDGEHRLSRPQDLDEIWAAVDGLIGVDR